MWSIGCIFAEMLLRQPLFPSTNEMQALNLIFNLIGTPTKKAHAWLDNQYFDHYLNSFPSVPRQCFSQKFPTANATALDLLEKLLEFNFTERITAKEALQHAFVQSFFTIQDLATTYASVSKSPEDIQSVHDYLQFETQIDYPHSYCSLTSLAEVKEKVSNLIQMEAERYAPNAATKHQATNINSFFFYQADAKSKDAIAENSIDDDTITDEDMANCAFGKGSNTAKLAIFKHPCT